MTADGGAGDSIFRFTITQAGLYAVRCSWEEGGGDARLEWYTAKADGSRVLINDTANGGIKAYRAATSPSRAFARFVTPPPGTLAAAPNAPIRVELVDGSTAVDPATVKLAVDGADVAATVSKAGNVTTVTYTAAAFYAPNSAHTASLSFTEGTNPVKVDWSFRVANYQTIPRTAKVEPDLSKPGFVWNTFANSANQANNNARTEAALAGQLLAADGTPLPNNADPAAQGVAIAPSSPPDPANATIRFEIETVINFSQSAGDNNGNFRPDEQMPGIPQTDGSTDGIAAEILTYLELPAGVITMGVNSDDGFRTTAGQPYDAFAGLVLGEFNGGRSAADTIFSFVVEEAGVYAFRTIWEEGSGALLLN